ncbi:hypothetical protein EBL89_12795 [Cereibacter sphaeroides]|nr:hypothetical protein EBL89_12795 [Cereibacter sphaeroides]AZB60402.1 hypothetical protein EBL88_12670 [Cereibacter sphaeroides]MWP38788.1 hypothetical protein [Cereibacter sphaeroides]
MLILCPEEAKPPADLLRSLPAPLMLALVDCSIILHHLGLSHAIPDDADMAGVDSALPALSRTS